MSERLRDRLDQLEEAPCTEALAWVGDKSIAEAWETCHRGDWMLWYLEQRGVDCTTAGYWCAERARQHASAAHAVARSVTGAQAAWAAAWAAAARAAARAARAARAAEAREAEAGPRAEEAELLAIADHVRAHYRP